jgi:hypothetical protein
MLGSPAAVAATVLVVYELWLGIQLPYSHGARDFIHLGWDSLLQSHASTAIAVDPSYRHLVAKVGFDGQLYYFIALDPANARYYMDVASYRYTRILYPMAARLLAGGRADLIPYTLLLVNWLAISGGTLALAAWLRRRGASPWFALAFGLYPGQLIALGFDLTEPLSYALVALAIYLFDAGGRRRALWSGLSFALALLARESAIVFVLLYPLALLGRDGGEAPWRARLAANWRGAALMLAVSLGPFLLYKGFLLLWLGSPGIPAGLRPTAIPFAGLVADYSANDSWAEEARSVVIPALLCAAMALWALWKRGRAVPIWGLLANVLLFVVLLSPLSYGSIRDSARITIGVPLAALCCLPYLDRLTGKNRWWLWSSMALWLSTVPFLLLIPIATSLLSSIGHLMHHA